VVQTTTAQLRQCLPVDLDKRQRLMNELQAKLAKRLTQVQEGGLHFESNPTARQEDDAGHDSNKTGNAASLSSSPQLGPSKPAGGVDFASAISRRRSTVDGDGQTFESTPGTGISDAASGTGASSRKGYSGPEVPKIPKGDAADFRRAIDAQRANVDGGGKTWESNPVARTADASKGQQSSVVEQQQVFESQPSPRTSDAAPSIEPAKRTLDAAARLEHRKQDEAAQEPAKEFTPTEVAQTACQETTAEATQPACQEAKGEEDAHGKDNEEDQAEEDDDEQQDEVNVHADLVDVPTTTLTLNGSRVAWLIGLGRPPQPDQYESSAFSVAGYQPFHLVLRREGHGCQLLLQGPSGQTFETEAKLFAGKGWAKKSFRTWRTDVEFTEKFDIDLSNRNSILCGVIFKDCDISLIE